ncbi:hypothetical protein FXO38_18747 [Capsicum annuum]|nr:hypothetical protein FXO38_18747 [Capsicum annuum]
MLVVMVEVVGGGDRIMGDEGLLLEIFNKFVNELKEKERKRQEDKSPYIEMMKNNFFFFRSSTNDANKTPSPPLKSMEVSSWKSVSLSSGSFYDSGSEKKNFTDLRKSPHGHMLIRTIRRLTKDKVQMASEVSSILRNQVTERASAQENRDYVQENYQEKVKELKSETLLTTVLREKLYSEKMDIKQFQADLAATVRGAKKDKNINQLTNDLQECMNELGIVKAILPKVFQDRDFMWEKVKSCMHQNSTSGAAENVGTAAKPNGIIHEPVRADRPNAFSNNSSSVLSCIQTKVDIPSQTAGPSTFELPDHVLVGPGREGGVRSTVIRLRDGFHRKDQSSSASSSEGCGLSVKRSSSADAGHLGNATIPCTGDGSTCNNIKGINNDKSIDSGRPSLALRSSSYCSVVQEPEVGSSYVDRNLEHNSSLVICSSSGLESQGGDSSTSTSANQQILDLNLALAFQEKLSDPRITSMLKRKGRHTDRKLANLLQDKGLDSNFAVMLKENGLDLMILALLQRSSLDAEKEHHDSNLPVTDSNDVKDVLHNQISFSEELRLQGLGKWLQRCRVMLNHVAGTPERAWLCFSLIFILETKPPIPPLPGPTPGDIPSMSMQFQPMFPAQQAQPYGSRSSQQFLPLGHANVAMSNNHMPDSFGGYQAQINDHRFPSRVQPWMPISNHNVNSSTTMQKTGELAAPLVVLEHVKALEEQKRNRVEYLEFLKSYDFIKASSHWRKVQDRLKTNKRCSRLEKIDHLEIFQVLVVIGDAVSCDGGMVVSTDTVTSVADGGGRSGNAGDNSVVVLVLIDELVGSRDLPVAVDGGGVGGRGVNGSIWYLDDKSQIKDAVRMAEIGLTSAWTLDDFKVAIAKYISSPPMSDTNLKFVFEELLERAREKEEKEAKKRERLADEFYELLHASKEITASSKWEGCKSLFGDRQVASFGFIDLELVTRLQGPLENDN